MGSKLGFILSLLFLVQLFALVGDIVSIQFVYNNLDAVSVTAGYLISRRGGITSEVKSLVEEQAGASIEPVGEYVVQVGGVFQYRIFKDYSPLIVSEKAMEVAITRSIIIGYYG